MEAGPALRDSADGQCFSSRGQVGGRRRKKGPHHVTLFTVPGCCPDRHHVIPKHARPGEFGRRMAERVWGQGPVHGAASWGLPCPALGFLGDEKCPLCVTVLSRALKPPWGQLGRATPPHPPPSFCPPFLPVLSVLGSEHGRWPPGGSDTACWVWCVCVCQARRRPPDGFKPAGSSAFVPSSRAQ